MRSPKLPIVACFLLLNAVSCIPGRKTESQQAVLVEARQWSKVNGVVHYSGWKPYKAITIPNMAGYKPVENAPLTRYGGDPDRVFHATGYFYAARDRGRWWIVAPDGTATWSAGVNGVRPGSSVRNERALKEKYGTEQTWIDSTHKDLEAAGFNGAGCWSEVPLVRQSNRQCSSPLSYTVILNIYAGYQRRISGKGGARPSFAVFDTAFVLYARDQARKLEEFKDDSALLGIFSDNEIAFGTNLLDEYLAVTSPADPNRHFAEDWLARHGVSKESITAREREMFLGAAADRYYSVVADAIRRYDPNHMYLGSRLHGRPKHNRYIVEAAGRHCDVISINYYGQWEPLSRHFADWAEWTDRPVLITEFYTKGDDSGLPNVSGAGWRVHTQEDRGLFYENFCIHLLQMKNCVGWHWFRYMDNDPTDTTADESNNDSNKGIVDNLYSYYQPLTAHMKTLNMNRYNLIRYLDR